MNGTAQKRRRNNSLQGQIKTAALQIYFFYVFDSIRLFVPSTFLLSILTSNAA